ncbi:NAD-dependent epimerase/dehydratase family protein [Stygiolobus sp. RP850M]|uniref:NAD-dependent epimerase/dehydratase family protein n=1 Tax=Stygiolobus sp. RP850M TaxID=3133137 RepID=UPI00307FAA52
MKSILITGLGFLATNVAYYLSQNYKVTVTYRNLNPVKEVYVKTLKEKGVEVIQLDVLKDMDKLNNAVKEHDLVVNFIGEISGKPEDLRRSNYEVPTRIAEVVRQFGKLMIHTSASTYGITGFVKVEEKLGDGLKPQSAFEKTKLEGELSVYKILSDKVFIFRPTLVYGRFAAHVQFVTIYKLVKRGLLPDINISFMPISARYIAQGIGAIIEGKSPSKNYFYVTECEPIKITRLFEIYAEALNRKVLKIKIPTFIAKAALPSDVRQLLKYSGTIFDCSIFREIVPNLQFDKPELVENAKFLSELDRERKLIPT